MLVAEFMISIAFMFSKGIVGALFLRIFYVWFCFVLFIVRKVRRRADLDF